MKYLIIALIMFSCSPRKALKKPLKRFLYRPIKMEFHHIDRATTYNPVASQCDSDPLTTADNSKINLTKLKNGELRWLALSRDLLKRWGGLFDYGDTLTLGSFTSPQINGNWIVRDCLNERYFNSVDFLFDAGNNKPKLGICTDLIIKI